METRIEVSLFYILRKLFYKFLHTNKYGNKFHKISKNYCIFQNIWQNDSIKNKLRRVEKLSELKYKRVLLKLSGEVLAGKQKTGVDVETVGKYVIK